MVLWYLLSIHSSSNQNERQLTAQTHVLVHRAQALANQGGCHLFSRHAGRGGRVAVAGQSVAWACSGRGAAICVRVFSSVSHL